MQTAKFANFPKTFMHQILTLSTAIFILSALFSGCAQTSRKIQSTTVETYPQYLSYPLEYSDYQRILNSLENSLRIKLKNRGEAHITLITPPEYAELKKFISEEELHQRTAEFLETKPLFRHICIGEGVLAEKKTYFIVISSKDIYNFRKTLSNPGSTFDPNNYYPHITLGFTDHDLHIQDGLIKDTNRCKNKFIPVLKKYNN